MTDPDMEPFQSHNLTQWQETLNGIASEFASQQRHDPLFGLPFDMFTERDPEWEKHEREQLEEYDRRREAARQARLEAVREAVRKSKAAAPAAIDFIGKASSLIVEGGTLGEILALHPPTDWLESRCCVNKDQRDDADWVDWEDWPCPTARIVLRCASIEIPENFHEYRPLLEDPDV